MNNAEEYFHLIGKAIKGANSSKIFGHQCYAIGRKPFFFLEEEDAVFKLKGKLNQEAKKLKGARFFDPADSGKKIKSNWVQLSFSQKDHWEFYAKQAFKQLKEEIGQ